jgi:two-component system response regulator
MSDSPVAMLVVEDNPADVVFFREAVDAAGLRARLHVVDNGGDALAFLRRQGRFGDAPRPDVVVLDLNIPVRNGCEVLQEMKADSSLAHIPVAILTTSSSEGHVANLYTPGRCRYLVKTPDFDALSSAAAEIHALALAFRGA